MNTCDWYDYESMTCNIDDKECTFAIENDKGEYGLNDIFCEKERK